PGTHAVGLGEAEADHVAVDRLFFFLVRGAVLPGPVDPGDRAGTAGRGRRSVDRVRGGVGRLRRRGRLVGAQGAADDDRVGGDRGRFGDLLDRLLDRLGRRLGGGGVGGGFWRGLLAAGRKQQGEGDGGHARQAGGFHCGALEAREGVAII